MDLSRAHFYKTIEEAETAIKQYFKEHYFIRLNRPRRIKIFLFVGNHPQRIKELLFVGNHTRRIKIIVIDGNHPRRINIILFVVNRSPTNKKKLFVRIPDE